MHRCDRYILPFAELDEGGHPQHFALVGHEFTNDGNRLQARQSHEVNGGLGVTGALAHTSVHGPQRQDMSGAGEAGGGGGGGSKGIGGQGYPLVGRTIHAIHSCVANWAAMTASPSFSRPSSSTTMTGLPTRSAATTSEMVAMLMRWLRSVRSGESEPRVARGCRFQC